VSLGGGTGVTVAVGGGVAVGRGVGVEDGREVGVKVSVGVRKGVSRVLVTVWARVEVGTEVGRGV
jgi:hypothetical protein